MFPLERLSWKWRRREGTGLKRWFLRTKLSYDWSHQRIRLLPFTTNSLNHWLPWSHVLSLCVNFKGRRGWNMRRRLQAVQCHLHWTICSQWQVLFRTSHRLECIMVLQCLQSQQLLLPNLKITWVKWIELLLVIHQMFLLISLKFLLILLISHRLLILQYLMPQCSILLLFLSSLLLLLQYNLLKGILLLFQLQTSLTVLTVSILPMV